MKKVVIIVLVLGTLGGLGMLVAQRAEKVQKARAENQKEVVLPKTSVKVVGATLRDFSTTVEVSGEVRAKRVVQVFPKVGGRIEEMALALGQQVKKGEPLARIEENDLGWREQQGAAGERAASAAVRQAQAQVDILKIELNRAEQLHKEGALPEADLVRVRGQMTAAQAAMNAARAQVDVARAGSGLAKEARSWTIVESPIDGVITRVFGELGGMAAPPTPMGGTPLLELQDQSALEIRVDVPAAALDTVLAAQKDGRPVTFRVTERPGKTYEARVKAVARALDPMTRRVRVELEASGSLVEDGVLPAMMATVIFATDTRTGLVAVPRDAVLATSDGPAVFVVKDGKVKRLKPGKGDATHVSVAEGLAVGDQVVVEGQETLVDGAEVQVVSGTAKADEKATEPKSNPAVEPKKENAP